MHCSPYKVKATKTSTFRHNKELHLSSQLQLFFHRNCNEWKHNGVFLQRAVHEQVDDREHLTKNSFLDCFWRSRSWKAMIEACLFRVWFEWRHIKSRNISAIRRRWPDSRWGIHWWAITYGGRDSDGGQGGRRYWTGLNIPLSSLFHPICWIRSLGYCFYWLEVLSRILLQSWFKHTHDAYIFKHNSADFKPRNPDRITAKCHNQIFSHLCELFASCFIKEYNCSKLALTEFFLILRSLKSACAVAFLQRTDQGLRVQRLDLGEKECYREIPVTSKSSYCKQIGDYLGISQEFLSPSKLLHKTKPILFCCFALAFQQPND